MQVMAFLVAQWWRPCKAGDAGSIPGLGRSGGGNGSISCMGDVMDRGACWATVWDHIESDTTERLNNNDNE